VNEQRKKRKEKEKAERGLEHPTRHPLSDTRELMLTEDSSDGDWDAAEAKQERLQKEKEKKGDARVRDAAHFMLSFSTVSASDTSNEPTRGVKRKASSRKVATNSDSGSPSFSPSSSSCTGKRTSSALSLSFASPFPFASDTPFSLTPAHTHVVRRARPFVRVIGKIYRFECEFGGCEYASDQIGHFNRHMHNGVT
jgi:hypothetical protein